MTESFGIDQINETLKKDKNLQLNCEAVSYDRITEVIASKDSSYLVAYDVTANRKARKKNWIFTKVADPVTGRLLVDLSIRE